MSGWKDKLNALGYSCLELTSDSPNYDLEELLACSVFIATPEKIDSMFRSQENFNEFASRIGLVMIDEVRHIFNSTNTLQIHTISEQSRGATLEVVVTRMMTSQPRIIAVSATCPNISDVGFFL